MPKNPNIQMVMVLGSGPIIIGQAAEFDYAGTQACRALKEEGIEVVLVNSNPATIMTDKDIADRVYIEPLNAATVAKIIKKEKPDSILPTLGGQNALNIAMELEEKGFLAQHDVTMLGTSSEAIRNAEDRQAFKDTLDRIGEPYATSKVVHDLESAIAFTESIGYPVVIRPAYTLGGTGGGIAHDYEELVAITTNGLRLSRVHEVLVERYIGGWKEIEYEVMRDSKGNVVTICNMENIDPVGVHTGDSIVVAPSQTLADKEHQMLRTSALNIISELKIEGGCNVQFALHPDSFEYCVIEVNPRVSRSSALASKPTGYPIAKVAAKVALGYGLDEIKNAITGKTCACFEPMLDYCVVKIPKWPFDKFVTAKRTLGTQMKATGEVMGIAPSFEGALMKSIRSLEQNTTCLKLKMLESLSKEDIERRLHNIDDRRIFVIAEAMRRGVTKEQIHAITKIDLWFLDRILSLVEMEEELKKNGTAPAVIERAKYLGFIDKDIAAFAGVTERTSSASVWRRALSPAIRWWIPVRQSSPPRLPTITRAIAARTRWTPHPTRRKCWFWAPVPSASARALSLTTARFTASGRSKSWALKPSLSTTIPKPFPPTSTFPINFILNPSPPRTCRTSWSWKSPTARWSSSAARRPSI